MAATILGGIPLTLRMAPRNLQLPNRVEGIGVVNKHEHQINVVVHAIFNRRPKDCNSMLESGELCLYPVWVSRRYRSNTDLTVNNSTLL